MKDHDLIGRPFAPEERELWDIYQRLKAYCGREDLPPCAQANARLALAVIWQAVNDLNLEHEPLDAYGA